MSSRKTLEQVEVGDYVWVHGPYSEKRIQPVARLTAKQIILGGGPYRTKDPTEYNRYWRGRASRYGGPPSYDEARQWGKCRIAAVATAAERKQWDTEQAEKARAAAEASNQKEQIEQRRQALYALFEPREFVSVSEAYHQGGWNIGIYVATDEQARALAAAWNALNAGQAEGQQPSEPTEEG